MLKDTIEKRALEASYTSYTPKDLLWSRSNNDNEDHCDRKGNKRCDYTSIHARDYSLA